MQAEITRFKAVNTRFIPTFARKSTLISITSAEYLVLTADRHHASIRLLCSCTTEMHPFGILFLPWRLTPSTQVHDAILGAPKSKLLPSAAYINSLLIPSPKTIFVVTCSFPSKLPEPGEGDTYRLP